MSLQELVYAEFPITSIFKCIDGFGKGFDFCLIAFASASTNKIYPASARTDSNLVESAKDFLEQKDPLMSPFGSE